MMRRALAALSLVLAALAPCNAQSTFRTSTADTVTALTRDMQSLDERLFGMTRIPLERWGSTFMAHAIYIPAMGVDQHESTHRFDVLPSGGRIALQMKGNDSLSIAQIRAHLKLIEHAFQAGDFSTPEFVHMRSMPGTEVMSRNKARINYSYGDLPRGGEVRITTKDPESLAAIREFMAAQRMDHHAQGMGGAMKLGASRDLRMSRH